MKHLTPQEQKAIAAFTAKVRSLFGSQVDSFRIFGSRARGDSHENSDVDILVLMEAAPAKVRGAIFELSADILLEFEIDISPLVMSRSHFEEMKARERLLPLEIERDGIEI